MLHSRSLFLRRVVYGLALAAACLLTEGRDQAQSACGPTVNAIACENQNAGSAQFGMGRSPAPATRAIQGFATEISVTPGQVEQFKVDTTAASFTIDIYRMGYYGGMGARKVATVSISAVAKKQPACLTNAATGLIDCGNWTVSASWTVPATAVSGIYFARLTRADTGGASHVVFIVRESDAATHHSDMVFQTSDTTWQAYNHYGGNSLYTGHRRPDAPTRSATTGRSPPGPTPRAGLGLQRRVSDGPLARGQRLRRQLHERRRHRPLRQLADLQHKVFLSVGHDEYWSGAQRANVEAARDAGVNLAFFSGNEVFWKTRWENSIDGSGTPYRTLVCYKETHANAKIDPQDPPTWTGTWRDPRFSPPADGGRPRERADRHDVRRQ